jgi:Hydrogenase maturation factor
MPVEVGKLSLAAVLRELAEAGVEPELDANEIDGLLAAVNPAIGVPDELLGFFAFHYSASNVAAAFGKPEFALLDLVLPPGYPEEKAFSIIRSFASECRRYGVRLVGGHTGRYEGAEYPIASSTVVGRRVRSRRSPAEGDDVYLVGMVGAEAAWLMGAGVEVEEAHPPAEGAEAAQRRASQAPPRRLRGRAARSAPGGQHLLPLHNHCGEG